ncbi:hypothetical protein FB561_6987 [Kribbella amoyensis]|uniref:Uncharacterized protein n=2 Tax=Kribbella amoyensis TaxID=996641 RepID=A0A561B2N7_9ACTN|nr:hypothetical protein FB561_6987 [Kribbella amoyensis]
MGPTDVVGEWEDFVESCTEGYLDDIYEFNNDLDIRALIERLLNDRNLARFQQMGWVRAQVSEVDEKYRAILRPEIDRPTRPWWEARLPRLAGAELAEEFRLRYGVEVEVVND